MVKLENTWLNPCWLYLCLWLYFVQKTGNKKTIYAKAMFTVSNSTIYVQKPSMLLQAKTNAEVRLMVTGVKKKAYNTSFTILQITKINFARIIGLFNYF